MSITGQADDNLCVDNNDDSNNYKETINSLSGHVGVNYNPSG